MFYFKNRYEPSFNKERKSIPGLSKYWRYSTLDSQNNSNLYSCYNNPTIQNMNNKENTKFPNDITIEVSYDNFYVLGVDMMKKKKYAEELKAQIEEKRYLKKLEEEKRKLDEIKDDLRIEKERKIIEQRQKENNKMSIPKINLKPLQKLEPIKVLTPRVNIPPKLVTKYKTPKKIIKKKYIYKSNDEDIINYLRERERNLEIFNTEMIEQINGMKNDFNIGMRKLNEEIGKINNKNDNKKLKLDDLIEDIRNIRNNKKNNIEIEHIYSIIRKNKDGKFSIQQFANNDYLYKFPINFHNINNFNDNYFEQSSNDFHKLPYINLSHQITYK